MASKDERVLVLAPLGRDARVTCDILRESDIDAEPCASMDALLARTREGAGVVIVTDEALTKAALAALIEAFGAQPAWSDLPVVTLLSMQVSVAPSRVRALAAAVRTSVLQRPVPAVTLVTTIQTLLTARRRQYEVRDLIERERVAREHAEAATRIKDEFLATISHELRTPLSAILLWSRLLDRGGLDEAQTLKAFEAIRHGAEAQSRLIEDLLDLSRMLRGKVRLERAPHVLGALVTAALEVVEPMAQAKGVRLQWRIDDEELVVFVDSERIEQVIWNLASNAVKFTPAGGAIDVRVTSDPEHAIIAVSDTGVGIPPELLPHVFERFRQGDAGAGRRHAGLGVGVPIVKELVELHGGTVEVARLTVGTELTVRLPLTR